MEMSNRRKKQSERDTIFLALDHMIEYLGNISLVHFSCANAPVHQYDRERKEQSLARAIIAIDRLKRTLTQIEQKHLERLAELDQLEQKKRT